MHPLQRVVKPPMSWVDSAAFTHDIVYRNPSVYCGHPHMAVGANGTWLLVFTQAPRRKVVLHPPLDPAFRNMLLRSDDEGRSWSAPQPVPDASSTGMECAGLTPLADGSLLLNQWQFGWMTADSIPGAAHAPTARPNDLIRACLKSQEFAGLNRDATAASIADLFPLVRHGGTCWVRKAADEREPFTQSVQINTQPFVGGYGMRGGVVLPDGDILLPLCDAPYYRAVFVTRSGDAGKSWGPPIHVASGTGHEFEEPAPILLPNGQILMLLRDNISRFLHAVRSDDAGVQWTDPVNTGIEDYPADLTVLRNGLLALVAGRRRPPFGIALYLSNNGGFDWSEPVMIRDDLPNQDLGYPTLAQRNNGDLMVAYYGRDRNGTTSILSTCVSAEFN